MICQHCGTEYENDQMICPRCGCGKPKARAKLPKWAWWLIMIAVVLSVIGTVAGIYLTDYLSSTWMDGKWGGKSFAVTFDAEMSAFELELGADSVIRGTYIYDDDSFELTAEDGTVYVYNYERVGTNRLRLSFKQNGEEKRISLKRGAEMKLPDPKEDTQTPVTQPEEEPSDSDIQLLPTPEPPAEDPTPEEAPQESPVVTPQETPEEKPQETPEEKPQETPEEIPEEPEEPVFSETDVDFEEELELPRLYLQTEGGVDVTDRENYINMTAALSGAGDYNLSATNGRIRGRGNSTWLHFDKKPYRLKFDQKVDLFGMGANKDWVLLANAFDETMLRYYLAFSLAHELGLEYTGEYQYINVFLNGEYRGVYLLTEQIEEGNSRVDVNSSKTGEVDTGYLIEAIGNSTKEEEERYFLAEEVDGKRLYPKQPEFRFYIKSPDETECTDKQYEYIKNYVTDVNEAIFKQDWSRIQSLVDVNSMAKMFLVDQVMLNNDMGYCFYLYKKKGDKLYFGPMWDYDQSCGGSSWGGPTYKGYETGTTHEWYMALIEIPEFRALVQKIYNEHKAFIRSMPDLAEATYLENKFDFDRNNDMWSILFGDTTKWRRMKELMYLETYQEHLAYLKTWLNNRIDWLEGDLSIT